MKLFVIIASLLFGVWYVGGSTVSKVSDKVLQDFTEELLKKDANNAAHYVHINYQGRTRSDSLRDEAPAPLITINSRAFQISTISKLRHLYDNYVHDAAVREDVTPNEKAEENNLLDSFMSTSVMRFAMNFLANHGYVGKDIKSQKDLLTLIWFTMYSRGGGIVGSSAFEHVFLGELKRGEVSGLHNWVYFGTQEAQKHANYLGYMRKLELGGKGALLKLHYRWSGVVKPVGSMFIGTSPELEMALYTVCFMIHPDERCYVKMAGKNFSIKTHTYHHKNKKVIGSAFPEI